MGSVTRRLRKNLGLVGVEATPAPAAERTFAGYRTDEQQDEESDAKPQKKPRAPEAPPLPRDVASAPDPIRPRPRLRSRRVF